MSISKIFIISMVAMLAIVVATTHASNIGTTTLPSGLVLNIVHQDNFEKYLTMTTQKINDTTFNLTFTLDPALKADILACTANLGACDKQALKNKWLADSSLTLGDIVSDLQSIHNMPITAKTKIGHLEYGAISYVNGFSLIVEFTDARQEIQIGQHSIVIDSATTSSNSQSDYVVRTINRTQIFAFAGFIAYKSLDGGLSWTIYPSGIGGTPVSCGADNLDTVHCLQGNQHASFNMSNLTWTPAHTTTINAGTNTLIHPLLLRDGSLVTLWSSGSATKLWRGTNYGLTWTNVWNGTGQEAFCGDPCGAMTETPDGYIHVLKTRSQSIGYFNISESGWASSAQLNITPTSSGDGATFLTSSPNGTIYGFSNRGTAIKLLKFSNSTKALIVNTTLQIFNISSDGTATECGGISYDVGTGIIYIECNNATQTDDARSWVYNSTDDGQTINTPPMFITNMSTWRSYISGAISWSNFNLSGVLNNTLDMVSFSGTTITNLPFLYDNITISSTPSAPPAVPSNLNIVFPANNTYFANNMSVQFSLSSQFNATSMNCVQLIDSIPNNIGYVQNGTTSTNPSGELSVGSHTLNITCMESLTSNLSSQVGFSVIHWKEVGQLTASVNTYELAPNNFNISLQFTGNINASYGNLTYNNIVYNATAVQINSTLVTLTASNLAPIATANISAYNYNWSYGFLYYSGATTATQKSNTTSQNVYQVNLIPCNSTAVQLLNFSLFDEETNTKFSASGLAPTANKFEATFTIFNSTAGDLGNRNLTLNLSGSNTYAICLLNNITANPKVNADIRYFNDSYSTRFYFMRNFNLTPPTTIFINLYLLASSLSSPISFKILQSDGITPATNVVIVAQRQYIDNNSFQTVDMSLTDADGKGFMYLKMNTVYHKFQLYIDGVLQREISPLVIGGSDVSAGVTLTYSLASGSLSEVFQTNYNVPSACTTSGATVLCQYNDQSGHLAKMFLTVYKMGVTQLTKVCQNTSTASSGLIQCTGSNLNGTYYYWLQARFSSTPYDQNVYSGQFRFGATAPYGTEGLMFAFIIILVFALIGSFNPVATVLLGLTGTIISVGMGFLDISVTVLIGFLIVGGILMYKIRG